MGLLSLFRRRATPRVDEPLVCTIDGNIPLSQLQYHHEWEDNADFIRFREWYTDARGRIVRDDSHLLGKVGGTLATALPGRVG